MGDVLALDLGTTSLKAELFDEQLCSLSRIRVDYRTDYPAPGYAEQNADQWWHALSEAVHGLYINFGELLSPENLDVIAIDAMAPTVVAVDSRGTALRPAIIWMDRRATAQSERMTASLGRRGFDLTGNALDPTSFACKILWLRDEEPDIYSAAHSFLFANSYLVYRLTGRLTADVTNCGMSGLCDTVASRWSEQLIEQFELDGRKLPGIMESTDIVGGLTARAAEELRLPESVRVIAGSMDNAAAVLGTGIIHDRELCISAGTATNVNLCRTAPHFDRAFQVYRHIVPDLWIHAGAVDYGGAGYKWFAALIGEEDYTALDERAMALDPGQHPVIFLPYMVGQRAPLWNNDTRGVLFGLDPSLGDAALARAFMEGNAYGVRRVLDLLDREGVSGGSCRLTGGCAGSRTYSQIFADVLGLEIHCMGRQDTATRGIAMAAAYAAGLYPDFASMSGVPTAGEDVRRPEAQCRQYYDEAYGLFVELYESLLPSFGRLTALRKKTAHRPTVGETAGKSRRDI